MKNSYYWTCPDCGANLDPNEKCDCKKDLTHEDNNYKSVQGGGEINNGISQK
jgi:transcription initiation factor IIE alpha subunit